MLDAQGTISAVAVLHQMPGLLVWKDLDSRYYGCNQRFAELAGFREPAQAVDKFDDDMLTPGAMCAETFRLQDKQVLATKQPIALLDIQEFTQQQEMVVFTRKTPLYGEYQQLIGTICHLTEINNKEILELTKTLLMLDKKHKSKKQCYKLKAQDRHLTTREAESLFYILRGKSSRQIAKCLCISQRTVEVYTDSLKTKFACASKAALIEEAIEMGYLDEIPQSLFDKQLRKRLA